MSYFRYFLILILVIFSFNIAKSQTNYGSLLDRDLPCELSRNFDSLDLDSIRNSTVSWISGNQECVYSILDKITDLYIKRGDFTSFSCLTAVCNNAIGKIADYLIDVNGSIFYSNFGSYVKYLYFYQSHYNEEHCMVRHLISALSLQIASSSDQTAERKVILEYIKTESKKTKLTSDEISFINSIYAKVDPKIWEKKD